MGGRPLREGRNQNRRQSGIDSRGRFFVLLPSAPTLHIMRSPEAGTVRHHEWGDITMFRTGLAFGAATAVLALLCAAPARANNTMLATGKTQTLALSGLSGGAGTMTLQGDAEAA